MVLLDFWATWCGPCREELPTIEKISEEYNSQNVQVWGFSLDEEALVVKNLMRDNHTTFRTMIDPDREAADKYEVGPIPAIIVIGRSGKVVSYYDGKQPEEQLRAAIDLALRENQ